MPLKEFFTDYLRNYFRTVLFGFVVLIFFFLTLFLTSLQTNNIDISLIIAVAVTFIVSLILQFFVFKTKKIPAWFGIMEPFYKKYYGEKTTSRMHKLYIIFIIAMLLFFLIMILIQYDIIKI